MMTILRIIEAIYEDDSYIAENGYTISDNYTLIR